ncbi:uncharacterized protein PRCAT00003116001 [Priceomyces carsonii]|uniref:uncharacterized protein n=1 Tax=Priceomyces carsonii TaxID=28549 RepID=UPI002ED8B807|nr:unnamed protein product [Priceomyces carsonii]
MTCDTGRPCKRCVQRGLQDTCEDAPRKRKKYLADVPTNILSNPLQNLESDLSNDKNFERNMENQAPFPSINRFFPQNNSGILNYDQQDSVTQNTIAQEPRQLPIAQSQAPPPDIGTNGARSRRTNFLSSAADLEYSQLSNILNDHLSSSDTSPNSVLSPMLSPHNMSHHASIPQQLDYQSKSISYFPDQASSSGNVSGPNDRLIKGSIYDSSPYPKCDETINQFFLGPSESDHVQTFPDVLLAIEAMRAADPAVYHERFSKLALLFTIGIITDESNYTPQEYTFKEPEEIYAKVNKPFSYTPGYHSLISYLRKRFPREMLVHMAESMAAYRPSFIACTNSLKEGDLIFMEQCFQRTLLTYDNFIKVSGTPTIVWRRTGEIAYVGTEFCILTGWSKNDLMGKERKFIVELLDDKSVVEYFQLFLRIAFGDFLGATMTECTLLTPKNDIKIRTGCIWTLKRDVFGIPMMIIGNFLPIV